MKTHTILIALAGLLSLLAADVGAEPGKFCWSVQQARVVPCPVRAPPNECEAMEHCKDGWCWCGPADAFMGPDESGLPLAARELEGGGYPCAVVDVDGAEQGDCSGWYRWACTPRRACFDDLGNRWWPEGRP